MKSILCSALLVISALGASAQDQEPYIEPDAWVQDILERRNMQYAVMNSNESEFRIETELGNGRAQGGFIDSKISAYQGIELRDILSLVLVTEEMPAQDMMYKILEVNEQLKMGFFEMFHNGASYVVRYKCRVPAYLNERDLIDIYYYGITVSDELEKLITGGEDIE
ncbi:MAG: hypothetical protein KL787_03700 [Taibaiella sp.]|nr:hypothetical protein [Taibaiella sp.]